MNSYDMQNKQISKEKFKNLVVWQKVTKFTGMVHHNSQAEFVYLADEKYADLHLSIKTIWGNKVKLSIADILDCLWEIFDMWQSGALR